MSRLTQDRTGEPVSRGQILRRERKQENIDFSCSADHEQDWQPCPVDPYSAICDGHTYMRTYIMGMGEVRYGGRKVQIGLIQYSTYKYTTTIFLRECGRNNVHDRRGVRNMLLEEAT